MKTKTLSIHLLAVAATLLFGGPAASAQSFLYNVDANSGVRDNNAADTYSGAAVLGNAGDSWNGVFGSATLQGATAGAPAVTFTYSGEALNGFNPGGLTANPLLLMEDYYYQSAQSEGQPAMLTLAGLSPGAAYTLVLYGAGDSAGQGSHFDLTGGIGGNSASQLATSGTDRNIANGIGDAYNTFTGTVGTVGTVGPAGSLTVDVSSNGSTEYAVFNGLQLQISPAPEPSTWALLGLGAGVLVCVTLRANAALVLRSISRERRFVSRPAGARRWRGGFI